MLNWLYPDTRLLTPWPTLQRGFSPPLTLPPRLLAADNCVINSHAHTDGHTRTHKSTQTQTNERIYVQVGKKKTPLKTYKRKLHHKEGSVARTHTCTLAVSHGATSKPKLMLRNDVCYSAHCVFLAFCRYVLMCVCVCVHVPHSPSLYASLSTQILLSPVSLESEATFGTRGIPVLSPYVVRSSSCLVLFVPAY